MKRLFLIPIFSLAVFTMAACGEGTDETRIPERPAQPESSASPDGNQTNKGDNDKTQTTMKINIKVNNQTLTATMEDNEAAKDFLSRLPLEVTLKDFNNTTEKIFYPDPALKLEGVAGGCAPEPGDITIYEPWNNVAIFCKSWSHSDDLIKIGHIDGDGIKTLSVGGDIKVRFEKQNK